MRSHATLPPQRASRGDFVSVLSSVQCFSQADDVMKLKYMALPVF